MRNRQPTAFSLPELLAVVGIIGVLIAILLPALARSRAEALRVRCMSNLRQLLLAQQMYVNDSKDYLTYPNWSDDRTSEDVWPIGWLYQQGKVSTPPRLEDVEHGALFGYIRDALAYRCPAHPVESASAQGTDRMTSYIMNGAVCGFGAVGSRNVDPVIWEPSWKLPDWRHPSEQILWWEAEEAIDPTAGAGGGGPGRGDVLISGAGGAPWNDGSSYPFENFLSRRHGRGACIGCFDGHAEWMDRVEFIAELQRPGPNRLWCDPHRPDGGRSLNPDEGGSPPAFAPPAR